MWIKLCLVLLILSSAVTQPVFKLYPLANDHFDIIYEIKSTSGGKQPKLSREKSLFLRVYCKQLETVSISLTQTLQFREQPRFPVYSQSTLKIPKFQSQIYTFLSACHINIKPNPRTNSLIEIYRRDSNISIFQLTDLSIKQGHNMFTIVDKSLKWGIGERFQQKFKVQDGKWTIWNRDKPWEIDHGQQGRSSNSYGHQPVYLARQKQQGNTHLTYFKNTHGILIEAKNDTNNLVFNSEGGNIHFVVFVGDKNPQKVLRKYHDFIGGIHIPPFWSLGWHQCRWGYKTLQTFTQVVKKYHENDLPLDTMWNDLDYMDKKAIFTIDQNTYPSKKLSQLLIDKQLHYIPLIDVGVSLLDDESINLGTDLNVFLRSVHNPKEYYVGEVWPGKVHFVDYLHPNSTEFWKHSLNRLYQKVPFSGVWLDMNEPSNFRGNQAVSQTFRVQQSQSVNQMTIDVNLLHYNYNSRHSEPLRHWQVHSYYGHTSTLPTFDFLQQHKRPFIISRSNSVGTGKYAGHWTGDNQASWDFLRLSISGNFLFQIFGIQMVGADICGFHQNTNQELCARWMQLGSLYPFARNHNQDNAQDQQPYALGKQVLAASKISLKQRYSLLKQLYSILVDLKGLGSFFRPIYFEFFEDQKTLKDQNIETEFLLGHALLSTPIVEAGKSSRNAYFPGKNVNWHALQYDLQKPGLFRRQNVLTGLNKNHRTCYQGGIQSQLTNHLTSSPPLFLRSGQMIFTNIAEARSRLLTNKFYLTAALNSQFLSSNRFLTIGDYENQKILGKCIEQSKCMTTFKIKKIDESQFQLKWQFDGDKSQFGQIQFISVTIWEKQLQYISDQANLKINDVTGTTIINVLKKL